VLTEERCTDAVAVLVFAYWSGQRNKGVDGPCPVRFRQGDPFYGTATSIAPRGSMAGRTFAAVEQLIVIIAAVLRGRSALRDGNWSDRPKLRDDLGIEGRPAAQQTADDTQQTASAGRREETSDRRKSCRHGLSGSSGRADRPGLRTVRGYESRFIVQRQQGKSSAREYSRRADWDRRRRCLNRPLPTP